MHFTFSESASRDVKKLPKNIQKRLRTKLRHWQTAAEPLSFGKRLSKHQVATHRFRVGAYRLLVKQTGQELRILQVRHRKDVYKT